MKSPSEIAREIAEEVLIKSGLYQRAGVWPDDIDDSKCLRLVTQAITTERQRQERLVEKVRDVWKIQMNEPSSKEDSYMRGMANGLELAMSILEDMRQPNYIEKPNKS